MNYTLLVLDLFMFIVSGSAQCIEKQSTPSKRQYALACEQIAQHIQVDYNEGGSFYAYDSLVSIENIDDFGLFSEPMPERKPLYAEMLSEIIKDQSNIYDLEENKNIKVVIYFSFEYKGFLFADVFFAGNLASSIVWPKGNFSTIKREMLFNDYSRKFYEYSEISEYYFHSERYKFCFRLGEEGSIEYVDHINYEY